MTEQEWLACVDPTPMLVFLRWAEEPSVRSRTSDRKTLLFACACCAEVEWAIVDERSKKALSTARRFAEGRATVRELDAARAAAWEVVHDLRRYPIRDDRCRTSAAHAAAYAAAHPASRYALGAAANASHAVPDAAVDAASWDRMNTPIEAVAAAAEVLSVAIDAMARTAKRDQVLLLRDIIGNPFRPETIDPISISPEVALIARGIYVDQAFDRLPLHREALGAAGCDRGAVLEHCRSPGPHVRGCWVVDSLLGKG